MGEAASRVARAAAGDVPGHGWLTVPNAVTLVRLALIVPVCLLVVRGEQPLLALVMLVLFGASDWVDGTLARRLGQSSAVGAVLDPVADRIGMVAIVLAFVVAGRLPLWVVVTILLVDVALGLLYLRRPGVPPRVTPVGKVRTAVLMVGVALLGLGLLSTGLPVTEAGQLFCAAGAVLHLAAGIGYLRVLMSPAVAR